MGSVLHGQAEHIKRADKEAFITLACLQRGSITPQEDAAKDLTVSIFQVLPALHPDCTHI